MSNRNLAGLLIVLGVLVLILAVVALGGTARLAGVIAGVVLVAIGFILFLRSRFAAGGPTAACIAKITGISSLSYVKVRSSASVSSKEVMQVNKGLAGLPVLNVAADQQGDSHQWFQLHFPNGKTGWVRDDLISIQGSCASFGYGMVTSARVASTLTRAGSTSGVGTPASGSGSGLFPKPINGSIMSNPFDSHGHKGWDYSPGTTIFSGAAAGKVVRVFTCSKCTPQGPNAYHLDRNAVENDSGWGWGFGHHVIVCYQNSVLPASTKQYLSSHGHAGHHIFVMYAHMSTMKVSNGNIAAKTPLGIMGNTGYSSAPHLHIELRAGSNANTVTQTGGWAALGDSLDPGILFTK